MTRIHSAIVRLWLDADGVKIPLAQVGPDFVITEGPANFPAITCAEVVVEVDGDEKRRRVQLPEGVRHQDLMTRIENLE